MDFQPQTTQQQKEMLWALSPSARTIGGSTTQLIQLANLYAPISLQQMDDVALLNRVDTKFLLTTEDLYQTLDDLQHDYSMLVVQGSRLNTYRTLYFDTPKYDFYHAHVNERPERYKVRSREYVDSQLAFLEVKHHTRKNRTIKERICATPAADELTGAQELWLRTTCPVDSSQLTPVLWNTFTRMTLVSKGSCERVTIDANLAFYTCSRNISLKNLVVIEVKTEENAYASPFIQAMRTQRIRRQGFSKYAIGMALLFDQVKKNSLKPKILGIEKLLGGQVGYE